MLSMRDQLEIAAVVSLLVAALGGVIWLGTDEGVRSDFWWRERAAITCGADPHTVFCSKGGCRPLCEAAP